LEAGVGGDADRNTSAKEVKGHSPSFQLSALEQSMPADAVLAKEGANEVCFAWSFSANKQILRLPWCHVSFCRVLILL
jgi:hypothetical protein